jgi:lysophospholipase L1-like esterase
MRKLSISLAIALITLAPAARAADAGDWITTWAASPQPLFAPDFIAPNKVPANFWNQTLREVASITLGGKQVRLVISDLYGKTPMPIDAVHVALAGESGAILPGSDHAVTFDGQSSVVIPPGAEWISDPVDMKVAPLSKLAVSLYFKGVVPVTTSHWEGRDTAFITVGDTTADENIKPSGTMTAKPFLTGIMVDTPADARAVVTFGDSITDGDGSTPDKTHRWPDFLAKRLSEAGQPIAVVNEGISGARVLSDRMGVNALARFDHDVIAQPHVSTVILMMGINDIGWPEMILDPTAKVPSASAITNGYKQLIDRAHLHGVRVIGATLTPFEDTFHGRLGLDQYYNPEKEKVREAVNNWIRTSGTFDGVIDFDALARDPDNPKHIKASMDSGDHLHPNDAAYEAMAGAIDLGMLRGNN